MRQCDPERASVPSLDATKEVSSDQPAQRIGRRLIRAIAFCAIGFASFPLSRAVELSCALAVGDPTSAGARAGDMSIVERIGEIAGTVAHATGALAGMCAAALAALALATILIAIRARTPRIGATVTALALFAAVASHSQELRASLLALAPGAFGIATTAFATIAAAVLVARWVEDVALSVALERTLDPLAISADIDAEAGAAARSGVSSIDQASYRLAGALGQRESGGSFTTAVVEEPALSGQGSPIPCRMPDDGPLPVRAA